MGAYRLEGQRRLEYHLGASHGFRRPGVAMFVEPGVSFNTGPGALWMALPVSFYVNRKPDPYTGIEGDATFPKVIFLAGYQFRFGGHKPASTAPITPSGRIQKIQNTESEACRVIRGASRQLGSHSAFCVLDSEFWRRRHQVRSLRRFD